MTKFPTLQPRQSAAQGMSPLTLRSTRRDVEQFLGVFFAAQILASQQLDSRYALLWQALRQVTLAGGKRLRPFLTLLSYQAYGGESLDQVLPVAVAHELLHTSLLIHDDIIDKDYVRHGQPNIAGLFQVAYQHLSPTADISHYASSAALLAGDLLLSAASQVITTAELPDHLKLTSLQALSHSIFVVGGGEFLDTEAGLQPFDAARSLRVADLKTAHYSFVAPLQAGAILAGANARQLQLLADLGRSLGIAYQLADDIIGLYGDETISGKTNIGDVREAKRTYLMAQALTQCTPAEARRLQRLLGKSDISDSEALAVRRIVRTSGAKADTLAAIQNYVGQALDCLEQLQIPAASKAALRQIVTQATERVC